MKMASILKMLLIGVMINAGSLWCATEKELHDARHNRDVALTPNQIAFRKAIIECAREAGNFALARRFADLIPTHLNEHISLMSATIGTTEYVSICDKRKSFGSNDEFAHIRGDTTTQCYRRSTKQLTPLSINCYNCPHQFNPEGMWHPSFSILKSVDDFEKKYPGAGEQLAACTLSSFPEPTFKTLADVMREQAVLKSELTWLEKLQRPYALAGISGAVALASFTLYVRNEYLEWSDEQKRAKIDGQPTETFPKFCLRRLPTFKMSKAAGAVATASALYFGIKGYRNQ